MNNTVNMKENAQENANVVHGKFRQGIVARAFCLIKSLIERRNTIRQLNALSDRMLLDIGIERAQIRNSINHRGAFTQLVSSRTNQPDAAVDFRRAA